MKDLKHTVLFIDDKYNSLLQSKEGFCLGLKSIALIFQKDL